MFSFFAVCCSLLLSVAMLCSEQMSYLPSKERVGSYSTSLGWVGGELGGNYESIHWIDSMSWQKIPFPSSCACYVPIYSCSALVCRTSSQLVYGIKLLLCGPAPNSLTSHFFILQGEILISWIWLACVHKTALAACGVPNSCYTALNFACCKQPENWCVYIIAAVHMLSLCLCAACIRYVGYKNVIPLCPFMWWVGHWCHVYTPLSSV